MLQELALLGAATDAYKIGGSYMQPVPPGIAIGSNEAAFRRSVSEALSVSAPLRELAQRRAKLELLLKAARKLRHSERTSVPRD